VPKPVLRIRDVYPGSRILIFTHPGSGSATLAKAIYCFIFYSGVPDPGFAKSASIRIDLTLLQRIRIRICNTNPDPEAMKLTKQPFFTLIQIPNLSKMLL
jgi:hypothetical protein